MNKVIPVLLFLLFGQLRAQDTSFLKGLASTGSFESLYDCAEANDGSLYFVSNGIVPRNDTLNTWSTFLFKTDKHGNLIMGHALYSTDTLSIFQNIFIRGDSIILFGRVDVDSVYYFCTSYFNMALEPLGSDYTHIPFPDKNYYVWQYKVIQADDKSGFYGSGLIDTGNLEIRFPLLTPFYTRYTAGGQLEYFHNNMNLIKENRGAFANNLISYKDGFLGKMRQYMVVDVDGSWERPPVSNGHLLYKYDHHFNLEDSIGIEYTDTISKPDLGIYTRRWCYMNQPVYFGTSFRAFGNDILMVAAGDSGNCNSCSLLAYHPSDFLQLVILDSSGKLKDKRGFAFDGYRECYKVSGYFPAMNPAVYRAIDINHDNDIFIGGYSSNLGNGNEKEQGDGEVDKNTNHLILACLDSNYTPKWKKIIKSDHYYTLLSIKATSDGGLLATCCRYDTANYFSTEGTVHYNTDLFAYKLNAVGNITSVLYLDPTKPIISAYPNPGNEYFQLNNIPVGSKELTLYDISGRLCKTYPLEHSTVFPTIQLDTGLYIYRLTNGQGEVITTGKWLKD